MLKINTAMPPLPEDYPVSASIVADSVNHLNVRLVTFELVFPRFILAELNTHRALSRNTSSSRAIPTEKAITAALDNMVEPVRYGINKSGMQAGEDNLTGEALIEAKKIWREMVEFNAKGCRRLKELGLHKQWASRPIEWFSTVRMVVSATELENFFWLRDHVEAQDEICYLAVAMKEAMNASYPQFLKFNEWHLPYISNVDFNELGLENALKVSAARCARTSYKTHFGVVSSLKDDLDLYNKLTHNMNLDENPFHASPFEHQARPCETFKSELCGNFRGWEQHRKIIELGRPIF